MFSPAFPAAFANPIADATRHALGAGDPLDEIIDALADAVLLVDDRGQVVHANPAGRRALAGHPGGLAALLDVRRPRPDRRRVEHLEAVSCGGVRMLTTRDGVRHVCHALQLRGRGPGSREGTRLRLVVIRTGDSAATASRIAQSLFGLTERERDVLCALVEIGCVQNIATALNISPGTTRSHLKALFGKTGTRRQSDLVRLLSDLASPFGPSAHAALAMAGRKN